MAAPVLLSHADHGPIVLSTAVVRELRTANFPDVPNIGLKSANGLGVRLQPKRRG